MKGGERTMVKLYIFDLTVDNEPMIEWGAGKDEDEALENVKTRLAELNDWDEDEAEELVELNESWHADEVDGYEITLK